MKPAAAVILASCMLATPALAQSASSAQQLLQGLLSGNKNQDQAVRDAFERGYQAGRRDEARMASGNDRGNRGDTGSMGRNDAIGGGNYPSGNSGPGYAR